MEFLLVNHPLDCPICDQVTITAEFGVKVSKVGTILIWLIFLSQFFKFLTARNLNDIFSRKVFMVDSLMRAHVRTYIFSTIVC